MVSTHRHRLAYNEPGQAHELTFSCYRRFPFLKAERSCNWLVQAIDTARQNLDLDIWAYVFMPDHVHLLVQPRWANDRVETILREIKQPVARRALAFVRLHAPEWLPRLAVRNGNSIRYRFWQKGGGFDRNVTEPRTLLAMIEYIHGNPVRRGLVERASDFRWSSAAWYEGCGDSPLRVDPVPPEWCHLD